MIFANKRAVGVFVGVFGEFNLGYLDVKDKTNFTIIIKMEQETSNEYQGKQIAFAVQVVATQVIE